MIIVLIICVIFAAAITGRDKRGYPVLSPDEIIVIGQKTMTVTELAEIYLPIVKINSANYSLPLLGIKYNIVKNSENLDLIYYFVWQDEIHPNPIVNKMYWIFRAAYYGYPVRDIEYFQITINPKSGEIEKIRFEASPGNDYYVNYSEHLIAIYDLEKENLYSKQLLNKATKEVITSEANVPVAFNDQHILVGVATWNHLSDLISPTDNTYDEELHSSAEFLTDKDYQTGKYVRKSQGDHITTENIVGKIFGGIFSILFFTLSGILIYRILFDKKNKKLGNNDKQ
ncbi:MAG: hypothetical protein C0412_09175 [Flavobacterium sp.]|nr:hypothetical protein [Flavobacterium sp.]